MSNLSANPGWDDVWLWDDKTRLIGGNVNSPLNIQAQALLNRTEILRSSLTVDNLAALRLVDSTKFVRAHVLSQNIIGDCEGGDFWADPSDIVSSDNNGTLIVAADGMRWKRAKSSILRAREFGAIAGTATDSVSAFARAITEASNIAAGGRGPVFVDLEGLQYGISAGLTMASGVHIQNGELVAIGSGWSPSDVMITNANTTSTGRANLWLDAQWKCAGVLNNLAKYTVTDRCFFRRFIGYGQKDTGTQGGSRVSRTQISQYLYGDSGYDTPENRNAPAMWCDMPDCYYTDLALSYSDITRGCLYVTGPLNQFIGIHPWNGNTSSGTNNVNICIETTRGYGNQFTGTYLDNGVIQMNDQFEATFINTVVQHNTDGNNITVFKLNTTTANEDAAGLVVSGMDIRDVATGISFTTSGSGSWATDKKISWHGVVNNDGSGSYRLAQWADKAALQTDGKLVIGATTNVWVGGAGHHLQIMGSSFADASASILKYGADTTGAVLTLAKSRGASPGTFSAVQSGDIVGQINFAGDQGGAYSAVPATVDCYATGNWTSASTPAAVGIWTTAGGSITPIRRWSWIGSGDFIPSADESYDIGSSTYKVRSISAKNATVSQTVFLSSGPYASDTAAATGGVGLNGAYRHTDGTIHWRQS